MISSKINPHRKAHHSALFNVAIAQQIRGLHEKMPQYRNTPLLSLQNLADHLGLKHIYVKNEADRLSLGAFKVLGSAYALARLLSEKLAIPLADFDFEQIARDHAQSMVFITATAGNHGRGVAWIAREMKQNAVILMPKGSSQASVDKILALGAKCHVSDLNYDDTVRLAQQLAERYQWVLVQDTAWETYQEIPTWISQGYMTMADEAIQQLLYMDLALPSHVMLQAGVGAMAGGVLGYLLDRLENTASAPLTVMLTEPQQAACLLHSAQQPQAIPVAITGALESIMAGLACGEVNPVTWPVLRDGTSIFTAVSDQLTLRGMDLYAHPIAGDPIISSGPSGAVTLGLLDYICRAKDNAAMQLKQDFGLNQDSVVLLFNTEAAL
ncbi:diaminopropionate ammonia-lyase [Acinetobacter larvae]|uniref:Diaminopropionate ammonia-lyase n=1 Tax=Acinetobacter larvae TaxID=1789224 RepID=A0A1B2M001_9GAMM|nr:diaminopropionate ammonia-lyase [Acinetobacter larvae]AOA58517.1 diaminopropionate ammonia-lyase [Acinetobacter larvae]